MIHFSLPTLLMLEKGFERLMLLSFRFKAEEFEDKRWKFPTSTRLVHDPASFHIQVFWLMCFFYFLNIPRPLLSLKKTTINGSCLFISCYIINWGFDYSSSLNNTHFIVPICKHYTSCNTSWYPQRATWISHEFINLFAIKCQMNSLSWGS